MGFLEQFRQAVASGALKADDGQEVAAQRLQALCEALAGYRLPRGFAKARAPRGLYIWGDVGRGKSMLMDMFSQNAPVRPKRRVHFNAFMGEAHARLHEVRRTAARDPIAVVAQAMAREAALLCFDEFQVSDVADAMILGRLFEHLFARGVVVVATSNTAPDALYQGGLNRQLFLPFIALMQTRMDVLSLNGEVDYRRALGAAEGSYHSPLTAESDAAMDNAFATLTGGIVAKEAELSVLGRHYQIGRAANGAARFSFDELCKAALGAGDYVAIAQSFRCVLIDHIPVMAGDEAKRFTLLIDTLYDQGVRLVCSAAAPPDSLCQGDGFARTASRLLEMQSDAYISRAMR